MNKLITLTLIAATSIAAMHSSASARALPIDGLISNTAKSSEASACTGHTANADDCGPVLSGLCSSGCKTATCTYTYNGSNVPAPGSKTATCRKKPTRYDTIAQPQ